MVDRWPVNMFPARYRAACFGCIFLLKPVLGRFCWAGGGGLGAGGEAWMEDHVECNNTAIVCHAGLSLLLEQS